MKQNFKTIILFAICTLFLSCQKDPPVPLTGDSDCLEIKYTSVAGLLAWPGVDTICNSVSCNPNNKDEFVYLLGIQSTQVSSLVKRNLVTGEEIILVTNVWRKPDWGINGWILFNHADNQVWKIKANGDSLTLITSDMEGGHNPVWSADGQRLSYVKQIGSTYYNIVCDPTGAHHDTLSYFSFYLGNWSRDNSNICGLSLDYLNVTYQNVISKQVLQPTNNSGSTDYIYSDAVTWTPDSKYIIWANPIGLYKTNVQTNQTVKLREACNRRFYTSLSISSDGNKIIAQRTDQMLANNYLYIKKGLSIIDIDGKKEVIIK